MKIKEPMQGAMAPVHTHSHAPHSKEQPAPENTPVLSVFPWLKAKKATSTKNLLQVLHDIRSGTGMCNLKHINQCRSLHTQNAPAQEQTKAKWKLQGVMLSGTFPTGRENQDLQTHSQLLGIDIDEKGNKHLFSGNNQLQELVHAVRQMPCYVADWNTVRYGKRFLFKIRGEQHAEAFESLLLWFTSLGVKVDTSCRAVSRLCAASYDPELQYNALLDQDFCLIPPHQPTPAEKKPTPGKPKQRQSTQPPADKQTVVGYVLHLVEQKGFAFVPGARHNYAVFLSSMLNQFGVPLAIALDVLSNEIAGSEKPEHHTRTLTDIYKRYSWQHGTKSFQNPEAKYLPSEPNFNQISEAKYLPEPLKKVDTLVSKESITYTGQSIYLKRYLSEVQIPERKKLIINVPTNGGKTFYFCKVATGKRILLVPTVALALQVQSEYGVKAIYEGVHVSKRDEVMVSTYESLQKILLKINVGSFQLWVDEAHNLVQASSMSYRNKSLMEVSESFEYFDRVILLSGTWISTQAEPLQGFELLNVISEGKKVGNFFVVPTKNRLHSLAQRIAENTDTLHVIYLNDVKRTEATAKTLTDLGAGRFVAIHSKNKHEKEQKRIIEKGLFPADVRGIVITDVFKEGLSLVDEQPFMVHLLTKPDSITTEQVINRVRRVVPDTFCYTNPKAKQSSQVVTEAQRLEFEQVLKQRAEQAAGALEQLRHLTFNISLVNAWSMIRDDKRRENLFQDKYNRQLIIMPKDNTGSVKINHFGIANSAYQYWADVERSNLQMYLGNLRSYGYIVKVLEVEDGHDAQLTATQQANTAEIKELEQQQISEILAEFEGEGYDYVEDLYRVQTAIPLKLELAGRWLYLYKRLANVPDITAVLAKHYSKKAWNRYRAQLENQIYINTQLEYKRSTNRLLRRYMSAFETGRTYTADEVQHITKGILSRYESTKAAAETLSATKAVQDLGLFFTLSSSHKKENCHRIIKAGALDVELKKVEKKPIAEPQLP